MLEPNSRANEALVCCVDFYRKLPCDLEHIFPEVLIGTTTIEWNSEVLF